MPDREKRLEQLKTKLEAAEKEKVRAEARLEQLQKEETNLKKAAEELGVSLESLDDEIAKERAEVDKLLGRLEELLAGL